MKYIRWWLALIILLAALGIMAVFLTSTIVYANGNDEAWPWVWWSIKWGFATSIAWVVYMGIFGND